MIATLFHTVTGAALLAGIAFALTGFLFIAAGGGVLLGLSPFLCGLALIGLSFWGVITGRR